jgi:hypothetical protein
MKRLTKDQLKSKADLVAALRKAEGVLTEAVEEFNAKLVELFEPVERALEGLNGARDDARSFAEEVVSSMEDYASDRSDRWRESDAGQEFDSWRGEWENVNVDSVELDAPEPLEAPDGTADDYEALQEEVG